MSQDDNPYAINQSSQLQGSVSYGGNTTPSPQVTAPSTPVISDTTTADFAQDVIAASNEAPVIVDFWAPWCGPCKQLTPIIENAVQAANGAVKLVKMNIDDHPEIAGQMGVQSIPAVVAFVNGKPVDGFMGLKSEGEIKEFIAKLASMSGAGGREEQINGLLDDAEAVLKEGDLDKAAQAFSLVMQHDQGNPRAIAGIVDCMLATGKINDAEQLLQQLPDEDKLKPEISGAIKRVEMSLEVAKLGDPIALTKALEDNPQDYEKRANLAKIYNAKGEKDKAIDCLVMIMKSDREWNDDGARKLMLDFFEAWGPTDPATILGRRKLSSLLFA